MTAAPVRSEWRKSSYSGNTGGDCFEVADLGAPGVALRDSKDLEVGLLTLSPEAYVAFVAHVAVKRPSAIGVSSPGVGSRPGKRSGRLAMR
ncbi:DUF397 domain-containing protein [Streptomyces coeruleorubidus]|uniref:DUF397 domain-containing protein n=1 Tax=Streptomyces coeruleorubidus TaxID=116188 RepID=UPI0037A155B2